MPPHTHNLKAVFNYYQSSVKVNPEGDVHLSDETIHGLGTTASSFLVTSLFGAITNIAAPAKLQNTMPASTSPIISEHLVRQVVPEALAPQKISDTDRSLRIEVAETRIIMRLSEIKAVLTQFVPDPGYFLAGAISGVASRTTTAPLDRLKVYLIAQTDTASDAVHAAKSGAPVRAFRHGTNTLVNACKDLWAAGGIRSLFAGGSTRNYS